MANSPFLKGEIGKEYLIDEVVIQKGFLEFVLDKFYELFDEINSAMNAPSNTTTTT